MQGYSYEYYKKGADYILDRLPEKPEIALILGTALGSLSDEITDPIVIDYADIPNFLVSTVKSHAGQLIFGKLGGKSVIIMSGRFHYYEGYTFEQLALPIRIFQLIGVKATILTNAAGAINHDYQVGDIMIIKDHIKLTADNPMRGPNVEEFGNRFFGVTNMYTPALRETARKVAERLGQTSRMQEGVYFYCSGPAFETAAEIRAMRILGGDAVGMSTVTEALTAAHCGMPLLGLSLMTNLATGMEEGEQDGSEVAGNAALAADRFKELLRGILEEL